MEGMTKPVEQPAQTDVAAAKQDIIDRTNALRHQKGVAALRVNDKLMQAAQVRADEMAASGVYSHTRPDGRKSNTVTDSKYTGENLHNISELYLEQQHKTLSEAVVELWSNSRAHADNMTSSRYGEIGVGLARGIDKDGFSAARRGPAVAGAVRDALSGECARLLALLEAPDLARDKVRHIERVARGVASADEVDSVLGVLIELLEIACDEQVVLLVDGYDTAWSRRASARDASDADPADLFDRVLFEAIATVGDSLRLTCLMGECPRPAEVALSLHGCSYCLTTPLSTWCDRCFGFSDAEVEALLNHAGHEEYLDDAREWLEGYRFGRAYCSSPARVIGFLDRGCTAPMRADLYGYADCLSRVIAGWNLDRLSVLFDLLEAHGCAEVPLCLGTAEPDVSPDDGLWTALYLSGFLTTDMTEEPEHGNRLRALRLPNNELRQALRLVIVEWFECAAEDIRDVDAFRDGLCRGNEDTVRRALSRILRDAGIGKTDPDTPLLYHLLLQGLCFGLPGYANPASRRKCGAGRWDIQVFPTGAVFDVADTIGMLDERPLITINLMYDPDVDALGLELLAVQSLLDIERGGIDEIRVPRPGVGRMRWGFGFDGQHVATVCQLL